MGGGGGGFQPAEVEDRHVLEHGCVEMRLQLGFEASVQIMDEVGMLRGMVAAEAVLVVASHLAEKKVRNPQKAERAKRRQGQIIGAPAMQPT